MPLKPVKFDVCVELDYTLPAPCAVLMQIEIAKCPTQKLLRENLDLNIIPDGNRIKAHDDIGTRLWLNADTKLQCTYGAQVEITRPAPVFGKLNATPLQDLTAQATPYLFPSRYCPLDPFFSFVKNTFGTAPSGTMVETMAQWINDTFTYDAFATNPSTTAENSFDIKSGVCRDYAHVLIAMCRAASIPARMVSVYGADVSPQDFHAIVEVFLDGAWHMVDPTGMAKPQETVVIGVGRDATDIAFLTGFGAMELVSQSVNVTRSKAA